MPLARAFACRNPRSNESTAPSNLALMRRAEASNINFCATDQDVDFTNHIEIERDLPADPVTILALQLPFFLGKASAVFSWCKAFFPSTN
jgi:hypothetical protein